MRGGCLDRFLRSPRSRSLYVSDGGIVHGCNGTVKGNIPIVVGYPQYSVPPTQQAACPTTSEESVGEVYVSV